MLIFLDPSPSFFPPNTLIMKLHGQFLCPNDSRVDLICHLNCKTTQLATGEFEMNTGIPV